MGGRTSPSPAPATTDPSAVHFLGPTKPGDCGGSASWASAQGPSSHTAQSGRWPGRWPRPGSGGEGWVPTGAKALVQKPHSCLAGTLWLAEMLGFLLAGMLAL